VWLVGSPGEVFPQRPEFRLGGGISDLGGKRKQPTVDNFVFAAWIETRNPSVVNQNGVAYFAAVEK
jgi:hypothetical protein